MGMGFIWGQLGEEREELGLVGLGGEGLLNLLLSLVPVAQRLG